MSERGEEFPYTTPAGSDASMFIQWKGTEVCLDFYCPCGIRSHGDGEFAYHVRCPGCDDVFEMGTQVIARRVDVSEGEQILDLEDRGERR